MRVLNRVVGVLVGVALFVCAGTAWADKEPDVSGTSSSDVTPSGAVLRGVVHPQGRATTYFFEYGRTAAYGLPSAAASTDDVDSEMPVSVAVTGLEPSTTYHYRLVAENSKGLVRGPDKTFTTLAGPSDGTSPGTGDPGTGPGTGEAAPAPDLGKSVLVAPGKGTLRVRRPGRASFQPLELSSELPMGSEVDAREGALALTSALPSGATQTGSFGGGRFVVRQGKRGYVDLYLRGRFCSATTAAARASAAARPPSGRRLWGRDRGGRFRTHGKNSHATVRGTRWLVSDSCRGTLTRVTRGSVVVTDTVRRKRVVLEAGERYLAPPRR
jgi:hypothetical protein